MSLFERDEHPRLQERMDSGPIHSSDIDHWEETFGQFNARLAMAITNRVGSMVCAYSFALLALISLPAALKSGSVIVIVSWVAQTFLQLVLLSVIMVGQRIQSEMADKRADQMYQDITVILHEVTQVHEHLDKQDDFLTQRGWLGGNLGSG